MNKVGIMFFKCANAASKCLKAVLAYIAIKLFNIRAHLRDCDLEQQARGGDLERVKKLLAGGACLNNTCALDFGVKSGNTKIVIALLEHSANAHYHGDAALKWQTQINAALQLSAKNGRLGMVTELLEHGADVHACEDAALRFGVENGHSEIVIALLEHGANARGADAQAMNNHVLESGVNLGNLEIVTKLLECGAKVTDDLLIYLVREAPRKKQIITKLIDPDANACECCNNNRTLPYHTRIQKFCSDLEIIDKLLEYGGNIHCRDDTILKNVSNKFNKRKAAVILPYCNSDDYHYFPDWFIKEMCPSIKSANKCKCDY